MTSGREWATNVGDVWAEEWRRTDRTFAELTVALDAAIDRVAPAGPGTALDIGCGAGITTFGLARRHPDLDVLGIDIAAQSIAVAEQRAAGIPNVRFEAGDIERFTAPSPFDLLISRHGVMFFDDPVAAFVRLHRAAKPGAPIVFSCMREMARNAWTYDLIAAITGSPPVPAAGYAPSPFAFADEGFTTDLLATTGWRDIRPQPVDYAYLAGEGDDPVGDAVRTFTLIGPAASFIARAAPERRPQLVERLREVVERHRDGNRVAFPASGWIWTAFA
ncbi:class I SAM-dependent methyltransferase [Sphingomonas sp. MMS24-J13]|uniref:class I SAM-dependent methyltransferase n=1 Tax=Sphingomonas sp. MMS24-J13 TaxID=3238686 RepID=UPI00384B8527